MIHIGCTQRFDIVLTEDLVQGLLTLGKHHYDGTCQAIVRPGPGSFIYGWANRIASADLSPAVGSATNRELQLALKICESLPYSRMLITPEQFKACQEFTKLGFAALRQADVDPRFKTVLQVIA